jgi:hypothetical protein
LYESISIVFDHESAEKGYIIVNQSNVLIKYSPSFGLGYAGLIFVMYPILVAKNFMSLGENYLLASKYLKAKMTLVAYSLFSPALLFFILSIIFSKNIRNRNLLLFLTLAALINVFAKNFFIVYKKGNKIT